MATIDYKEKYEQALEVAQRFYNNSVAVTKKGLEDIFPELAESEDKRIRKAIIKIIGDIDGGFQFEKYGILKKDALAWLIKEAKGNEGEIPISELNPADKVEPKFNAGDWIYHEISGNAFHINRIENRTYISDEGATISFGRQKDWRLWIIQDAKDGDVLADGVGVILFRKIGNEKDANVVDYHCAVFKSGSFIIQKGVSYWGYSKDEQLRPATKEQRERLFGAMRVAGYEWNADKKELKKIEQKPLPTWKPSDEQMEAVKEAACYSSVFSEKTIDNLISLSKQLKKLREE